jgi:hypothetical protein
MQDHAGDSEDDDAMLAAVAALEKGSAVSTRSHACSADLVQGPLEVAQAYKVSPQEWQILAHAIGNQQQSQHQLPQPEPREQKQAECLDASAPSQRREHASPLVHWECLSQQETVALQPKEIEEKLGCQQNFENASAKKRNRDMISCGIVETQRLATDMVRMAHFYELMDSNFQQAADVQWARICAFVKEYTKA